MAESAAAAAYAAETAVQGAAIGAYQIAKPTVPLQLRFKRLLAPSPALKRTWSTMDIMKGRAYIYGGDTESGVADNHVHVVSLPTDMALQDTDYQSIPPLVAPLPPASRLYKARSDDEEPAPQTAGENSIPPPRAEHSSTSIAQTLYIFGGRPQGHNPSQPLSEAGTIHSFSTIAKTWSTFSPTQTACSTGVPEPRTGASMTSSPHPLPSSGGHDRTLSPIESPSQFAETHHGTIFLHGGVNAQGQVLSDIWAFDIPSRIWSRYPSLPFTPAGNGYIICTESRLWVPCNSFREMATLELSNDRFNDISGEGELGISPKTGVWDIIPFGGPNSVDPEITEAEKRVQEKLGVETEIGPESMWPKERTHAGFTQITTGAGREYLLLVLGQGIAEERYNDIWSFQLPSLTKSAAQLKDRIKGWFGGETKVESWAKADVVHATKEEGQLEKPTDLTNFACASGGDWGSNGVTILWGGSSPAGFSGDGWVITVEGF